MKREFNNFLKRVKDYSGRISEKSLKDAYNFAAKVHEGDMRLSGDPVIQHVLETAKILTTIKVDEETLIAALLHEVPEYSSYSIKDISKKFGKNVGLLVSAFEKIGSVKAGHDRNAVENLRKMFLVMARDLRVVLIKLADRLHNMQTLEFHSREKQKKIARETLEVFVPIASRLGVYQIRSLLEDLCFKFLNREEYRNIQEQLKRLGKKRKHVIDEISSTVEDYLKKIGIKGEVSGRFKNTYSIYKKLKKKGKTSIDDIQDIFALRIVIPSSLNKEGNEDISNLYNIIGLFHNKWRPLPGRFKDYVGFPKPNGYQSLHTTVIGLAPHSMKEPVEIQIRTEKMHQEAEYGIAAHWLYKETKNSLKEKQKAHMDWIKSLAKYSENNKSGESDELINELKVDLFQDRIFVYTPQGDVRDLPTGSTPIDFAYSIHSDLGNKCIMAKANGSIVPLDYELKNGEVIEILTRANSSPKLEWISYVKTAGARTKIKNYFRSLNKEENFKEGKDLLNRKLEQLGKPKLDPKLSVLKVYDGKNFSLKEREEVVRMVGNGSTLPSSVIKKIYSYEDLIGKSSSKKMVIPKIKTPKESEIGKYIIIGGEKGLPVKIANCCKPAFGQDIIGYITRGKAISVHKKDCRIFNSSNPERHIEAKWIGMPDENIRNVPLVVETVPDSKIMRDVTKVVSQSRGNILYFYIKKRTDDSILWDISVEVRDFDQFEDILNKISGTKGIKSVRKVT